MCQNRHIQLGMTLVELLVVMAIIGVLVGLLLPAVQVAREASRRTACLNNIRQLGMASHQYHDAKKEFPRSMVLFPNHGWAPFLLPYLEEQNLYDSYKFGAMWDGAVNRDAIKTVIPMLLCPSSPSEPIATTMTDIEAAAADYSPVSHISSHLVASRLIGRVKNRRGVIDNRKTTIRHVKDGMSKTILFAEDAGRPDFWVRQGRGPEENQPGGGNLPVVGGLVRGAAWASTANEIPLHGFTMDGLSSPGPCAINCTNNNEAFSFHPGGVSIVFADGHTEFVSEDMSIQAYSALITRAGNDNVFR